MITLEQVEYIFGELALKHNLVGSSFAGPSIYTLNAENIKEYPFMYFSPTGSHTLKENTTRFNFTVFYVDRLMQDSSNEDNIGSVAVETIRNFHLQLKKLSFITDIQQEIDVRLFTETERLADRCAGAYASIWVEVLNSTTCGSFFDEYEGELGNWLDEAELVNILDNLASKNWVLQKIREIGGVTLADVDREIAIKLRPYATIQYVDDAIAAISGTTPEISGLTRDIRTLSAQTVENTAQISGNTAQINTINNTLSGISGTVITLNNTVTGITGDLADLSGSTEQAVSSLTQSIESLSEAISAATPADYAEVKAQVSANTQDIQTLSGLTGSLATDVHGLTTGFTYLEGQITGITSDFSTLEGQVTANTRDIQSLSAATSGYTTQIAAISAQTSGLSAQIAGKQNTLSGSTHIRVQNDVVSSIDLVASSTVTTIWTGSQIDYDLIATKDPHTVYIVV